VCLIVCEIETSTMRRPRPEFGCCVTEGEVIVPEHRCTSTRLHDVTSQKTMISTCPAHRHIRPALCLSTLLSDWSNFFFPSGVKQSKERESSLYDHFATGFGIAGRKANSSRDETPLHALPIDHNVPRYVGPSHL